MTEAQLRSLVKRWSARLVPEWRVTVEIGGEDGDSHATAFRSKDYPTATVCFNPEFVKRPDREVEETVVHELLHLLLRDVDVAACESIAGQLHRDVETVHARAVDHAMEGAIERLAWAFVEMEAAS